MKYRKGYKYQLAETDSWTTCFRPAEPLRSESGRISMSMDGLMTIREGYASDGPSGPTIDRKENMYAGIGHDGLYQLMREGLLNCNQWRRADEDYGLWLLQSGSWKITAAVNVAGLALMRGKYAQPAQRKEVFTV